MSWKETTLGNEISVLTDYTANGSFESLKQNVTYYSEVNYAALIRTTDLGRDLFKPERFTDKTGYEYLRKVHLHGGEIVVANVGSLGKSYRVPKYEIPMVLAPNMYLLKFKENVDEDFIFQFLQSSAFKDSLLKVIGSTTLQAVNKDNLRSISLVIPDKPEQTRIAQILSTADKAIAQTEALITKYQRIKTGLMQDLLTKGIDEHGNIRSEQTHRFKTEKGLRVPEEWEVENFKDCCELIKDGTHLPPRRVEEGVWLLGVTNIIDGEWLITASDTKVSEDFFNQMHKNWKIEKGDVLLAIVGATIGKVTQVPQNFPIFTLQRSVCLLRGKKDELHNDYLRLFIESKEFQRMIWNEVNVTAQPGIYLDAIGKFLLPKPGYHEQLKIADKINSLKKSIDSLKHNLHKLQSLKTGLMQDLLSGKVRVKI